MKSVSVVIPTYQRPATLRRALTALLSVQYPTDAYEVIVVDDASDDRTAHVVADLQATTRVTVISQPNLGASTARNAGARLAEGELLLFCDDDMIVQPSHLRLHVDTHEAVGRAVVGSDRWYTPESLTAFAATPFGRYRVQLEREFQSGIVDCHLGGDLYETTTLASCDMSIARAAFWELGGFDESFPYAGAEDQDLSIRAKRGGYRLIRNHGLQPKHDDQAVTLRQFGLREERGAETVVAFERKYPEARGPFAANRPLSLDDGPRLAARKIVKAALSRPLPMEVAYWMTGVAERAGASDPTLQRMYRVILGLHIFRGYRKAFRRTGAALHANSSTAETSART